MDDLLVRIQFVVVLIRWTGLAPWDFGFPFPGSRISTFRETLNPEWGMEYMVDHLNEVWNAGLSVLGLRCVVWANG